MFPSESYHLNKLVTANGLTIEARVNTSPDSLPTVMSIPVVLEERVTKHWTNDPEDDGIETTEYILVLDEAKISEMDSERLQRIRYGIQEESDE